MAKKYGLYTKITGGQRIDLFGAQVQQLPLIWQELIDAGFESGHAYGKALRTVKSCVGTHLVPLRRAGLASASRSISRIATRACARRTRSSSRCRAARASAPRRRARTSASSPPRSGWNLYVCGNGGMKPRHADLLARDLDTPTLIQYIDRFLMFYIRTGDRLQRTSTWLENLEGGIDYVRKVVCEDSLGIGAELEADMARVIGNYACEWKVAIEDPADAQALPPLREQRTRPTRTCCSSRSAGRSVRPPPKNARKAAEVAA